jgi:hypothetical protein
MKIKIFILISLLVCAFFSHQNIIIAQDILMSSANDIHIIKGFKTWNNDVREYKFKKNK